MSTKKDRRTNVAAAHVAIVHALCLTLAQQQTTLTYKDVARHLHLPEQGYYMGDYIGTLLGYISEAEVAVSRPMLSAVILRQEGYPGFGFWQCAKDAGVYHGPIPNQNESPPPEAIVFWQNQLNEVFDYWHRAS